MGVWRKGFKDMFERGKWKILRGDKVMITAGKDAGQVGTVLKVIRSSKFPRVVVEGLNLNKRSIRRTKDNPGGIVSVEAPLHYSNVALVDPVNGVPVRVTWRYLEDGSKVRVTVGHRSSASVVSRPEVLLQRRKPRNASSGPNDTTNEVAGEVTHTPGDLPSFLKQQLAEVAAAQQRPATQQQQQQRQYSTAAGGGSSSAGGLLGVAARLLGGARTQPLGSGGLWRGFAAGSLW
ncbi:50S ribosomal chloroplastic [Micractinium conductrix]|uniref:50S ribosomal chloroplastic n=1 Tax=Micractinium conductrix TaxID=554055 RepID=A0A2P6VFH7_9CHLO|nr:50S ribosomal chloroplastic [Micractinium conductrix]|eukprot:PSC72840.1 50S ribosomal chloroplastic [Micractinium conductrix]